MARCIISFCFLFFALSQRVYPCDYGFGITDGQCKECPNMTYSRGEKCISCDEGLFTLKQRSSTCQSCDEALNYYFDGEHCVKCPQGSRVISSHVCKPCEKGSYFNNDTQKCQYCPMGTYSNSEGLLFCQDCENSKTTFEEGSSKCEFCPDGTYFDGSCINCPQKYLCSNSEMRLCDKHELCVLSTVIDCGVFGHPNYEIYKCQKNALFYTTIVLSFLFCVIFISMIVAISIISFRIHKKKVMAMQTIKQNIEMSENDRKKLIKMYLN